MFYRGIETIDEVLRYPLFPLGDKPMTLGLLLWLGLLVAALIVVTRLLKRWVILRVLERSQMDTGVRQGVATLLGYVIIMIGFMIILQTAGIDLTTLNVLAGAVGIGVGFGLQGVVQNFISGIIILLERPIKVGDRIELREERIHGKVSEIRARSSVILTNDNVSIIVPNSKFVTDSVINWSYGEPTIRFRIPVSVAYGSDPREVERALLEAAGSCEDVLKLPEPTVRFSAFGESALEFELLAWTSGLLHRRGAFRSGLNFAIHDALKEHGIQVPFPQRDLHIRDGRMQVEFTNPMESKEKNEN
jgi:small-conductance mechanosensitive channel